MPNGATHTLAAAAAVAVGGVIAATHDPAKNDGLVKVAVGGTTSALAAKIPDILEPALHPHHRQFFHGIVFAAAVGAAAYKAYKWKPETRTDAWLRLLLLAGASGYLLHLLMDGCTPRGLPLVGRFPG